MRPRPSTSLGEVRVDRARGEANIGHFIQSIFQSNVQLCGHSWPTNARRPISSFLTRPPRGVQMFLEQFGYPIQHGYSVRETSVS